MAYSKDLRRRVVSFIEEGNTQGAASERYAVSVRTIRNWLRQGIERRKPGPKAATKVTLMVLEKALQQRSDAQQREIAQALGVHKSTVCVAMRRYKISRKKNVGLR
jgi:putative transposase